MGKMTFFNRGEILWVVSLVIVTTNHRKSADVIVVKKSL